MYDIIVVGAGPAGISAAIYARRANKTVLVLEKETFGGQITYSPNVENYPGFTSISGMALGENLMEHAMQLGAEFDMRTVNNIAKIGADCIVSCDDCSYQARAVIIAQGSRHRCLNLPSENELVGNGVSYCALCDGAFYKDKNVMVVGGGNTALQNAMFLQNICSRVTVVQNLPHCTGELCMVQKLESFENVSFIYNSVIEELEGETVLKSVILRDTITNQKMRYDTDCVFVAIGQNPDNACFQSVCKLDENGYILSDEDMQTGCSGIYAAGDCRKKNVRQVATAVNDGACAALSACRYIDSL